MNTLSRVFTSASQLLTFNQATLSGCVDVVVVRQLDGTLKSTPFHVRFGKLKVLKSKDKIVNIRVNDRDTCLKMKLGEAGEGFFEEEIVKAFPNQANSGKNVDGLVKKQFSEPAGGLQKRFQTLLSIKNPRSNDGVINKSSPVIADPLSTSEVVNAMEDSSIMENDIDYILLPEDVLPKEEVNPMGEVDVNQEDQLIASLNLESAQSKVFKKIKVRKVRPSSEMLQSLNLKIGCNTITYNVQTSLQGSQVVSGHIYYWPNDVKIIISDIDGTITKSDFLGHLMPYVGKDWSQPGIAPLMSNIRRNGYQILYLTSRPIGQARQTKEFLHSIYQDGKMLPHGPLIMSPDRVFPSMKREVVFRRPELFKMAVLKDIRSLFPKERNPFHAGFGNRETDAIAYTSVQIPLEKVYIINPKGDIDHNDQAMKSYALINTMVKDMFPDILIDPKIKLAENLDEANALQIDDKNNIEESVAKVIS